MSASAGLRQAIEEKMKELVSKCLSEIEKEIARYHTELISSVNRIKEEIR